MLSFRPGRVFHLRDVKNPVTFMMKNGINRSTASNLFRGQVTFIRLEHLERLCLLLRCTPNDLLQWTPDKSHAPDAEHPLNSLKREAAARNLAEIVKDFPLDKLDKIEAILEELKNE